MDGLPAPANRLLGLLALLDADCIQDQLFLDAASGNFAGTEAYKVFEDHMAYEALFQPMRFC